MFLLTGIPIFGNKKKICTPKKCVQHIFHDTIFKMEDSVNFSRTGSVSLERRKQVVVGLVALFSILISQVAAIATILTQEETEAEKRRKRKQEHEALPFMQNKARFFGPPQLPLAYRDRFGQMIEDPNRNYCKKLTHMYSWEIQYVVSYTRNQSCILEI